MTVVAVAPARALADRPRLRQALELAFDVECTPLGHPGPEPRALITFDGARPPASWTRPVLAFADGAVQEAAVRVAGHRLVDRRLHGLQCHAPVTTTAPPPAGLEVLATAGGIPAWGRSVDGQREWVRTPLPELGPRELLRDIVWRRPLAAIALIGFMRRLTEPAAQGQPHVRAAFVFDDPNLRRRTYGYIDYERLAAHADVHGYHAAMGMIPLDAGRPHAATAALFRRRRDRLSLVVHGNDHVKRELLRPRSHTDATAVAAQAIQRVVRFEARCGVPVDRVMMPPHGMCSRTVTQSLGAVGFDALCTIHPRPWTGFPEPDDLLAGWAPGDFVSGCAVIPRLHLGSGAAELALHAFLGHPLILYGHHEDLATGLEPLARAAELVHRLGDARWMPVGEIATRNFASALRDGTLTLRPYTRRARLVPQVAAEHLVVEPPVEASGSARLRGWSMGGGRVRPFGDRLLLSGAGEIEIRLHASGDTVAADLAPRSARAWPRMRRSLTEARDRALPLRRALGR